MGTNIKCVSQKRRKQNYYLSRIKTAMSSIFNFFSFFFSFLLYIIIDCPYKNNFRSNASIFPFFHLDLHTVFDHCRHSNGLVRIGVNLCIVDPLPFVVLFPPFVCSIIWNNILVLFFQCDFFFGKNPFRKLLLSCRVMNHVPVICLFNRNRAKPDRSSSSSLVYVEMPTAPLPTCL